MNMHYEWRDGNKVKTANIIFITYIITLQQEVPTRTNTRLMLDTHLDLGMFELENF